MSDSESVADEFKNSDSLFLVYSNECISFLVLSSAKIPFDVKNVELINM